MQFIIQIKTWSVLYRDNLRFDVVFTVTIKHLRGKKTLISSKVSIYDLTTKNRKSLIDSIIIILRYDMLDSLKPCIIAQVDQTTVLASLQKDLSNTVQFYTLSQLLVSCRKSTFIWICIPNNINAIELLCDTALILLNCSKIFHT